jgi:sulfatase modifying factor 1
VVNVSWNDASEFCRWLSQATGLAFRLPTEMEWEFACRAGNTTLFWNGNERDKLPDIANIADRSAKEVLVRYEKWTFENGRDRHVFTAPVGSFPANAFGLSDMHGNVLEWCQDQRQIGFRAKQQLSAIKKENRFGAYRVVRSSSWASGAASCRSAHRVWFPPETRLNDLGFRVVCEC